MDRGHRSPMIRIVNLTCLAIFLVLCSALSVYGQVGAAGYALRFYGNGVNDIDRVKIVLDDPATTTLGPSADVGASDFTLEFWLRAQPADNPAPAVACGANYNWIFGNTVIDRDRFNQDRAFGVSIAGGVIVFGVRGDGTGSATICGTTNVLDAQWHHIAVERRRADGRLWLYVDGRLESEADGPDGDISYPDDGMPGNLCGGPCSNDPYLVLGAEKHDFGSQNPSFAGWLDEVRISNVLRYAATFTRPSSPFVSDSNTVALYHFDEGAGDIVADTSGAPRGPSNGVRRFGGTPAGPEWVLSDVPFVSGASPAGLVAAYSFDEGSGATVADASGNGNTGAVNGAIWTNVGRFGAALAFNGSNTWVTVNDANSLDLSTGMTLEAWVYPTVPPSAWRTVIAKEGSGSVLAYFLHASSAPLDEPAAGMTTANGEDAVGGGAVLPVNSWTHLAATYDGSTLRLFVNGVEVDSLALSGAIVTTANPLRIGGNGVWGEFFQGLIDEVRIYNRALSATEIRDDMNVPISQAPNPAPTTSGLSPASAPAGAPTFTLTVTGSNFIAGSVVRWNGASRSTTYISPSQLNAAIPASDVSAPGTASVSVSNPAPGGGTSNPQTFTITAASNPVPTTTGLDPSSTSAGGPAFTLTVNGTNFVPASVVRWNGTDRATTYVSATQLRAAIAAADIAATGSAQVTVFTATPGGGTSNAQTFSVTAPSNPMPATTSLNPSSAPAGGSAFTLTVSGTGFVGGSVVRWNGTDRPTTFVSATQLTAAIAAADIAATGSSQVTVFTDTPGGGTSNAQTFTISAASNPVPTTSGLDPSSATAGGLGFTLTVNGTSFVSGSVVRWNGADRSTTYLSPTQLTAMISSADIAASGTATVTVVTPAPGGGTSNPQAFSIVAASPNAFIDDFNRPDGADLGNGWVEKNPGAFALAANGVSKAPTGSGYADNLVYRPAGEDVLDVEVSVEVRFASMPPGYAQVFVRGQTQTIAGAGVFNGYLLFTDNDPGRAFLSRIENGTFVSLAQLVISPGLNTTDTFRLRLRSTGTTPVALEAYVERFTGSGWTVIGQATVTDTAPSRFTTAGTVGFTGYVEGGVYTYDNFTRTNLAGGSGGSGTPTATALAPASAIAGTPGLTLTVTGSGFVSSSVVRWNGADRPTTYVSATELAAPISASDLSVSGTAQVTVFNPGGSTGNVQYFSILDPSGTFVDTFNRADSGELGNGWTEKYPAAFSIQSNEVVMIHTGTVDYHDAIAYRPVGEDQRDVEAALEFRPLSTLTFPQVHARIQRDTLTQANTLNDYMIFVDGFAAAPGRAVIARQAPVAGQFECYMLGIPFPSALEANGRYRVRLRVEGAGPVTLTGSVDRFDGTTWQLFATGSIVHDDSTQPMPGDYCQPGFMPPPITTAGAIGFAKWQTNNEVLDNFSWTSLTSSPSNPLPATTDLSPSAATAGGPAFTLTVNGSGFVSGSLVRWNGAARATTFVSATQLTAAIPATDIAAGGTAQVTVVNAGPGGGTSNPQTFTINAASNPVPALSGMTPSSALAGGNGFTLTVTGTNFVTGSVVRWNGAARTTTYVSATELAASIPAADIAAVGSAQVTVFNAAPGGGTSNAQTFTVTNPVPTTTALDPGAAVAGGSGLTLRVTGTNFVTGSTVRWNGSTRSTTYVSAMELTVTIPAADLAVAGTATITVSTAAPGGGTSNPQTFTITNPAPTLADLQPSFVVAGGQGFTLTVTGSNFVSASVVRWNGAARPTTYVSATQLRVSIPAADVAVAGTATVTVVTGAPGGGTSNPQTFTVLNPQPTITRLGQSSAPIGSPGFTLTVTGTNFVPTSVVRWNGADRPTTYVSPTEVRAEIPQMDLLTAGTARVTVFNPPPGGGLSNSVNFAVGALGDM
jgi:Concanavalin A-like lectin/glucanases superfamily